MNMKDLYGSLTAAIEDKDLGFLCLTWMRTTTKDFLENTSESERAAFLAYMSSRYGMFETIQPGAVFQDAGTPVFCDYADMCKYEEEVVPDTHLVIFKKDDDSVFSRCMHYATLDKDHKIGSWHRYTNAGKFRSSADFRNHFSETHTSIAKFKPVFSSRFDGASRIRSMVRCGVYKQHEVLDCDGIFDYMIYLASHGSEEISQEYVAAARIFATHVSEMLHNMSSSSGKKFMLVSPSAKLSLNASSWSGDRTSESHKAIADIVNGPDCAVKLTGFYVPRVGALLPVKRESYKF